MTKLASNQVVAVPNMMPYNMVYVPSMGMPGRWSESDWWDGSVPVMVALTDVWEGRFGSETRLRSLFGWGEGTETKGF